MFEVNSRTNHVERTQTYTTIYEMKFKTYSYHYLHKRSQKLANFYLLESQNPTALLCESINDDSFLKNAALNFTDVLHTLRHSFSLKQYFKYLQFTLQQCQIPLFLNYRPESKSQRKNLKPKEPPELRYVFYCSYLKILNFSLKYLLSEFKCVLLKLVDALHDVSFFFNI